MAPTKKQAAKTAADTATITKAQGINLDTALTAITGAQTKISRTLGDIQEELITKYGELAAVNEAIQLKREEMSNLHGQDAILLEMDELRARQAAAVAEAEAKAKALAAADVQARKDTEEARKREDAEHKYKRDQERKQDNDTWAALKADRERIEALRVADLDRTLAERQAAVSRTEAELVGRVDAANAIVETARAAMAKDHAIEINSIKREHAHAVAMTAGEHKATVSNLQKDVDHLAKTLASKDQEIGVLRAQLAEAVAAQTALASKTVDAASNRTAQAEAMATFTAVAGGGNGTRPRT